MRAELAARASRSTRGRDTRTLNRKTRLGRRVCIVRLPESSEIWRSRASLKPRIFASPFGVHRQSAPKVSRFRAGAAHPGGHMLAFVPVAFDAYRTVRPA